MAKHSMYFIQTFCHAVLRVNTKTQLVYKHKLALNHSFYQVILHCGFLHVCF